MISICLLTKNENRYIREWVQHHLDIGIDHFYIYDNNDVDFVKDEILKYFDEQYFTFVPWLSYCAHMQVEAYNDCLKKFGGDNEWIAFIDTDEFIDCENIHSAMEPYVEYDYIRIPWVMHNANGQLYSSNEPVRERFPKIYPNQSRIDYYKSIVRPNRVNEMVVHYAVGKNNNYVLVNDIKLDHYYTRSLEEWVEKISRGSCSPTCKKRYDEFFLYNPDLIEYKDKYSIIAQEYNDCFKAVDIRIMAHPSRRDNVLKILKQLNMDESIVVYDDRVDGDDAICAARRAWLYPILSYKTHRLVLQDDVLLCDNFINIVHDIISTLPDKVITLFNLIPRDFVKNKECCYERIERLFGCAIIMPVFCINDCWQWIDAHYDNGKHYDMLISEYCKMNRIAMFTTIPVIVQHLCDTECKLFLPIKYPISRALNTYIQTPMDDFTIPIPENLQLKKIRKRVSSLFEGTKEKKQ